MAIQRVILLSGAVCAGKTAVATQLQDNHGFTRLSTSGHLRDFAQTMGDSRLELQELGDLRDEQTDFAWVVDDVARPAVDANPHIEFWLLDAARKPRQVDHLRRFFGNAVWHVHLTAPEEVLADRYVKRARPGDADYATTILHPNEQAARSLAPLADITFDTHQHTAAEIVSHTLATWTR